MSEMMELRPFRSDVYAKMCKSKVRRLQRVNYVEGNKAASQDEYTLA